MSYITLTLQQDNKIRPYIIFNAECHNEAWLSEANDDGTTTVIKRFKCRKFRKCFYELGEFMDRMGTMIELHGSGIKEHELDTLKEIIVNKSYRKPKKSKVFNIGFRNPLAHKAWIWNQTKGPDEMA